MTIYYLDTSALIKRYVDESGSDWIRSITSASANHLLLTARISVVELHSAVARRRREGTVPTSVCDTILQIFDVHCLTQYKFVELTPSVISIARELLDRNPLRAYDAVQLASSIQANKVLEHQKLPKLIFVSADKRLNEAATLEGLSITDPNVYN
jgi:predicted nucleic acid-binding protein